MVNVIKKNTQTHKKRFVPKFGVSAVQESGYNIEFVFISFF